jgi:alpha-1,6-mannosyltransferase
MSHSSPDGWFDRAADSAGRAAGRLRFLAGENLSTPVLARGSIILICSAFILILVTGLLGPSATQPPTGDQIGLWPSYFVAADPSPWLVCGLIFALCVAGAYGVQFGLLALRRGWRPNLRRLLVLGVVAPFAVSLVPPMGSSDIVMYAAYGRIATHYDKDVYSVTPEEISRFGYDQVTSITERPWSNTPSVYGPIETWREQIASWVGGESAHVTVWILQVTNALAFVLAGLAALILAGRDPTMRARAVLLVLANPVLVWAAVGGGHNDAVAAMFGVMALVALRRSPIAAGVLLGCAGAVKLSIGLYGIAFLLALRRSRRGLVELCAATALVMGGLYLTTSPHVFDQVLAATKYMSTGTWGKMLYAPLSMVFSDSVSRRILSILAWVVLVFVVSMLMRVMPRSLTERHGAALETSTYDGAAVQADALRLATAITVVWLLAALYSLPWYDVVTWLPLAGLMVSRLDGIMVIRTAAMAIAYIPGRDTDISPTLLWITDRLRDSVVPLVQAILLLSLVAWARQGGAPWPWHMIRDYRLRRAGQESGKAEVSAG